HGALLIVERATGWDRAPAGRWPQLARRALTLLLVTLGWVFFRAPDLGVALNMLGHMLVPDFAGLTEIVAASMTNQRMAFLLLSLLVVLLPAGSGTGAVLETDRTVPAKVLRVAVLTVGLLYAGLLVATGSFSPFLYYQF
ncbi:MAG: MBOAT family protein, partial [Saccharopolyspora rectivirgula]